MPNSKPDIATLCHKAKQQLDMLSEPMQVINTLFNVLINLLHKKVDTLNDEQEQGLRLLRARLEEILRNFPIASMPTKLELAYQAYLNRKEK